jgi:hypothetical protein
MVENGWEGWGKGGLKPSHEPIAFCRKPIEKGLTVAENCLKWGVGGINIDESRVETTEETRRAKGGWQDNGYVGGEYDNEKYDAFKSRENNGRFPANLIHDGSDEVVELFPKNKGAFAPVKSGQKGFGGEIYGKYAQAGDDGKTFYGDGLGSAARFFYCAKASKSERNMGCDGLYILKDNTPKDDIDEIKHLLSI